MPFRRPSSFVATAAAAALVVLASPQWLLVVVAAAGASSSSSDGEFLGYLPGEGEGGVELEGEVEDTSGMDESSLLQKAPLSPEVYAANNGSKMTEPFLVALRRESVPIYRRGKVASFKTSYSGVLSLGTPAQEFRVVFDTGSGHLVLPAAECQSEACLVPGRQKFNMSASTTSKAINSDGTLVPEGEECDQVTIGFGTGEITGEFTKDIVCFDSAAAAGEKFNSEAVAVAGEHLLSSSNASNHSELCVEMSVILAVEMSSQPFKTFRFDGILGLGLDGLALSSEFSFFEMLLGKNLPQAQFGIFLTEGEHDEESEVSFGGVDQRRVMEPLSWANVVMPEHGHWQVRIKAVRIDGHELDICKDGTCRGVVDTGTSHLGVPVPADKEMAELLTTDAEDLLDCRYANTPDIEIELEDGYVLNLMPWNYMRRLPLREGVSVSSANGVTLNGTEANGTNASANGSVPIPSSSAAGEVAAADAATEAAAGGGATDAASADEASTGISSEVHKDQQEPEEQEKEQQQEAGESSEAATSSPTAHEQQTQTQMPMPMQSEPQARSEMISEGTSLLQSDLPLVGDEDKEAATTTAAERTSEAEVDQRKQQQQQQQQDPQQSAEEQRSEAKEVPESDQSAQASEGSGQEEPQDQGKDQDKAQDQSEQSSNQNAEPGRTTIEEEQEDAPVKRFCRPRLMPVRLPAPLGPKLFILGEPVLHRYYTVYDWANHRVGFSLARNKRNTMDPAELAGMKGQLPHEVDMLLMQQRLTMKREASPSEPSQRVLPDSSGSGQEVALPGASAPSNLEGDDYEEETVFMQVKLRMTLRERRAAPSP